MKRPAATTPVPAAVSRRSVLFGMLAGASSALAEESPRIPSLVQDGRSFVFIEPMPMAPRVMLLRRDGVRVPLLDRSDPRPILLNFWATWCPPCRVEIPFLQKLYNPKDRSQPRVLPVSIDKGGNRDVAPFLAKYGVNSLPVFLDPKMEVGQNPRGAASGYPLLLHWLPLSYVIAANGLIVGYFPGVIDWRQDMARSFFAAVDQL
ncbi:MAG: TlpA family protein disulfide reductase [Proteobacteria bacterium]|nr:TlpA family protein disulfide reductase [Pseudomonadota bacterium]